MKYAVLAGLVTFVVLATGCGAGASSTPTPPSPALSAEEVLVKAREAMGAVQSYRIRGEITGIADVDPQRARYYAEWAALNRSYQRFEGLGEAEGHINELIAVEDRLFVRDSDYQGGAWTERPVRGLQVTSGLPGDVHEPRLLPDEIIDGVSVFHVLAEHDPERPETLPGTATVSTTYQFFISKQDFRLVRMVTETLAPYSETVMVDGTPTVQQIEQSSTITYNYYDYNEPVTIELPEGIK